MTIERYVAVDNVCAWPNLTKMPDGAIVATIFNQPCHGRWEGDVECWASEDGGRTWRLRGTPAPHEPGTNRMNVAAGLARSGDLIVVASGWSHRPRKGEGAAGHGEPAHPLLPWVCRSTDGGRTWTHAETLPLPEGMDHAVPFGDIVPLADGGLGVSLYGGGVAFVYASGDDGRTWQLRSTLRKDGLTETTLLVLPEGHVLACARTEGDQHLEMFRSTDSGRSWRHEQAVSNGSQHPADLMALPDGRVLLTYGDRRQGHWGVEVRIGDRAGRFWGPPLRLIELESSDLGYPATVRGEAGTLVTAWYCSGVAVHRRYHMGVAVWGLEDVERPAFSTTMPVYEWMVSTLQPKSTGIAEAPCRGLGTPLGWTSIQTTTADGFINVHDRLGDADGIVYFARRFQVPRPGAWGMQVGHDGGMRLFVDGRPVLTEPVTRNPAEPGRSRVDVPLTEGEHEVVIAFDTAVGKGWGLFFSWAMPKAERQFPVALPGEGTTD